MFLHREWSYRHRSERNVKKIELRKMLAILKADQRTHPRAIESLESSWKVFLYMYCESAFDFHWYEIASWIQQNLKENEGVQFEAVFDFLRTLFVIQN